MKVIEMEARSGTAEIAASLRGARDELRAACALLRSPSPDAMTACARALQNAAIQLQAGMPKGRREGDGELVEAFLELRQSVAQAQRMLQAAAEYHANWLRRMCVMTAGYTAGGRPAAIDPAGRMSLRA